jgi:hypothetical protein
MTRLTVALLVLALLAAPLAAGAQAPVSAHRVGIIHEGGSYQVVVDGLRQGLRELGLDEGTHFVLDIRDTQAT